MTNSSSGMFTQHIKESPLLLERPNDINGKWVHKKISIPRKYDLDSSQHKSQTYMQPTDIWRDFSEIRHFNARGD